TLFMTLLGAWAALMSRLSGQDEVVVGTAVANRRDTALDGLMGFFVNTLALRLRPRGTTSVDGYLRHVGRTVIDAFVHQDVPFAQVVESLAPERSLGHSPVVQTMFVLQNAPRGGDPSLRGLAVERIVTPHTTTQFDLSLSLTETASGLEGAIEYASDLFDAETIASWSGYFEILLRQMVVDATRRVSTLPLLDARGAAALLAASATVPEPYTGGPTTFVDAFAAQVVATPHAEALRSHG
ncbi:hypothetical protein LTR23_011276, partial [Exophiala sp. CCFEE 6169]